MAITKKHKIAILIGVLVLSVGFTAFFAVNLALEMRMRQSGQAFYESLPVSFVPRPSPATPDQRPDATRPPVAGNNNGYSNGNGYGDPEDSEHEPVLDFDAMRESFPDMVAWIQSYGTQINYPVVQGRDNDFYLNHLPDKTKHRMGSVFLDYRNSMNFTDPNIFIYGHNMETDDIFSSFLRYREQRYFERHDSMYLFTPTADYVIQLFAGYILDATYETPPMRFSGEEAFTRFVSDIRLRSVFRSGVEIAYGDQLVFLCTCIPRGFRTSQSERFVLVGKLVIVE